MSNIGIDAVFVTRVGGQMLSADIGRSIESVDERVRQALLFKPGTVGYREPTDLTPTLGSKWIARGIGGTTVGDEYAVIEITKTGVCLERIGGPPTRYWAHREEFFDHFDKRTTDTPECDRRIAGTIRETVQAKGRVLPEPGTYDVGDGEVVTIEKVGRYRLRIVGACCVTRRVCNALTSDVRTGPKQGETRKRAPRVQVWRP